MKRNSNHFRGCLIGGAIGDAMGWPVEFLKLKDIKDKYGEAGITDLDLGIKGKAEITDDTQMTIFTAEGLLRGESAQREKGICDITSMVYSAYQRWLHTQGNPKIDSNEHNYDGWLIKVKELHHRRAPGNTCLASLESGKIGRLSEPINNSKGCGGVMRVAPIGLLYPKNQAFEIAVNCAATTHGSPLGYLPAGTLAYIIAAIIEGKELEDAIEEALIELEKYKGHEECLNIIKKAIKLSRSNEESIKAIEALGEGWVGEEALAIAIYCALKYKDDYKKAICTAINHDGDSDSTGSITGNILGAYLGLSKIPTSWTKDIELVDIIREIADDLLLGYREDTEWLHKYPGC